jgi:hypothetical protein
MALPSSGPLSISQIRNEEVNVGGLPSTYSLRQLSSQAGKSVPDSISEFYGYSPLVVNSATIWFNNIQDGDPPYPYGYIDAGTACNNGGYQGAYATIYYTGVLGNGTILYNYSNLTENFGYAGSIFWYWINFHKFTYTFNSIADYSACD